MVWDDLGPPLEPARNFLRWRHSYSSLWREKGDCNREWEHSAPVGGGAEEGGGGGRVLKNLPVATQFKLHLTRH